MKKQRKGRKDMREHENTPATPETPETTSKKVRSQIENYELTEEQQERLRKIRKNVTKNAKNTAKLLNKEPIEKAKAFIQGMDKRTSSAITLVVLTILLSIASNKFNIKAMDSSAKVDYKGCIIDITMNNETNQLTYDLKDASIETKTNFINLENCGWLKSDINTEFNEYTVDNNKFTISKDTSLSSLDVKKDCVYAQYNNKENTASKELVLATDIPNDIDLVGVEKQSSRFYEKSNPIQVKSYMNSYNNSFLMTVETLAGGELITKSLKKTLEDIESTATFSDKENTNYSIHLNFDEIGSLDLSQIDEVKESPEVIYTRDDGVLRVRNSKQDIDYIYITYVDNEKINCKATDLVATTNENLFIHKNFDVEDSVGFKTFALKSDSNLFIIKLNSINYESIQTDIFEQLGIDADTIAIKTIQKVVDKAPTGSAGVTSEIYDSLDY